MSVCSGSLLALEFFLLIHISPLFENTMCHRRRIRSCWSNQRSEKRTRRDHVQKEFNFLSLADSLKCIAWKGRALVVGFVAGQIEKVSSN